MLDSCRALEMEGFRVTYLPVQNNGLVDLKVSGVGIRGRVETHRHNYLVTVNINILYFYGIKFVISIYW